MPSTDHDDVYDQVEGRNPVVEALKGPRTVTGIWIAEGSRRSGAMREVLALASEQGVPVRECSRDKIDRRSRSGNNQGVLAEVSPYRYLSLDELLHNFPDDRPPLVMALAGVEDPRNFGALLRVADAAGVDGVVVPGRRSCPVTPSVGKSSAGAVEHVRVVRVSNVGNAILRLKKEGLWVVGAESGGGTPYHMLDLTVPLVLVLGSEGGGLGRLLRERCDLIAEIPMRGRVKSLNVATAGAVLVFEALRQRSEV